MPRNSVPEWSSTADDNIDIAGIDIGEYCPPSGVNNAERTIMAQVKAYIGGGIATLIDICVGTATNKPITPSSILAGVAPQILTDSATVTVDLATGLKFTLLKAVNGAMVLTNAKVGYTYHFYVTQDATGGRTMSKPTASGVTVKVKGGAFLLSITAGALDRFSVEVVTPTLYLITPSKGYS